MRLIYTFLGLAPRLVPEPVRVRGRAHRKNLQ